jgi:hypothetical protein
MDVDRNMSEQDFVFLRHIRPHNKINLLNQEKSARVIIFQYDCFQ